MTENKKNDKAPAKAKATVKPVDLAKAYQPQAVKDWTYERQLWQARLTSDGKLLAATGYDSTIQRWNVEQTEPQLLPALKGHNGWVQGMAFHPHRPHLYSADSWGRLCCWKYDDRGAAVKPLWEHAQAHSRWIRDVAISPQGDRLATCGDGGQVKLWSSDGKPTRTLEGHTTNVFRVIFHPHQALVLTGDLEGIIRVFDLGSGKMQRKLDASWLYQHHRIQHCGGIRCMAFDAAGTRLLVGGQQTPIGAFANGTPGGLLFDWKSGKEEQKLTVGATGDGFMYDVQFHSAGFMMGVSCAFPGKGHLWFWRPGEPKPFLQDKKFNNGRSLSLYPDGKRLLMLAADSPNGNGRRLKDGVYQGGQAKLRLLKLGA